MFIWPKLMRFWIQFLPDDSSQDPHRRIIIKFTNQIRVIDTVNAALAGARLRCRCMKSRACFHRNFMFIYEKVKSTVLSNCVATCRTCFTPYTKCRCTIFMYIRDRSYEAIIKSKGDFWISLFYTNAPASKGTKLALFVRIRMTN